MDVIVYVPNSGQDDIQQCIEDLIPEKKVKVYKTLEGFSERLHRPVDPDTIVVIIANSCERLSEVIPLRRVLGDIRTLVVAPDQDPETVSLAHQLRPRFLTHARGNLEDLAAVLRKMMRRHRGNGTQGGIEPSVG
jgi:hypothetical protein